MISDWKACLLERSPAWGLQASDRWNFILYNNFHPHISSMSVFWFYRGEKYPKVVTKVFHDPEIPTREFANLKRVHACAPGFGPTPLHLDHGTFSTLWMTGVPGMNLRSARGCTPAVLEAIIGMVADMHQALSRGTRDEKADRFTRTVSVPIESILRYGAATSVREGCRQLLGRISPEWLWTIPAIPQHGDLYPGHLVSDRGRWYVVDWESFGMIDLPLYDVCTLLLSILWESGNTPANWRTPLVGQASRLVGSYLSRLQIQTEDVSSLLPLALLNWFHIQWSDGRQQFAARMYETLTHYFEHVNAWEKIFVPR